VTVFLDIGIIVAMVVIALGAQIFIKRAAGKYDFSAHNAVAGMMLSIAGIVYAVVLGFVVVVAWQAFQRADTTAFAEVNAAADMYRYAPALGEPLATKVRADVRRYIRLEIDEDWPAMERGETNKASSDQINQLVTDFVRAPSRTNSFVRSREMDLLAQLVDSRRLRIYSNAGSVGAQLWATLIGGSILTIGMTFLFGMQNFRVHLLLTAMTTTMIAIMFVLILNLDHPFRGDARSSIHYWTDLQQTIDDPAI
jgi:hypothetical protein